MSIYHFLDKIKRSNFLEKTKNFVMPLIIVLTGVASFGLGRLSVLEYQNNPVTISIPDYSDIDLESNVSRSLINESSALKEGGKIVASKTGSKYHFPWCSGAKSIATENKIWFNSEEEARRSGYLPASNCKGLK